MTNMQKNVVADATNKAQLQLDTVKKALEALITSEGHEAELMSQFADDDYKKGNTERAGFFDAAYRRYCHSWSTLVGLARDCGWSWELIPYQTENGERYRFGLK